MNQIIRTLIISFGIVAGMTVLGVALFVTANVLAERQAQALVAEMDCHTHDEGHSTAVRSGWLDFLMPSRVEADHARCGLHSHTRSYSHTHCPDPTMCGTHTHTYTYAHWHCY